MRECQMQFRAGKSNTSVQELLRLIVLDPLLDILLKEEL